MEGDALTADLAILLLGVAIATSMVWVGIIGSLSGSRIRYVNVLFVALFSCGGWYLGWISLLFSGFVEPPSRVLGMPVLLTGFLGPLLWLFIYALLRPETARFRRWHLLVILPGFFGVGLSVYTLVYPEQVWAHWTAFTGGDYSWKTSLPSVLFLGHSVELAAFGLAAWITAARAWKRAKDPTMRSLAWHALVVVTSGVAALAASNFLPLLTRARVVQVISPLLTVPALAFAYYTLRATRQMLQDLEVQRRHMSRYLPSQLVNMLSGGALRDLEGREANVTILFSDIRGFTSLSERLPAAVVVEFLNDYFGAMTDVVFRHNGMLNKFIGDAVLAVFGIPPRKGANHAMAAVACAREMFTALKAVNERWARRGHDPIRIGVGLHSGTVVHGNVGSGSRVEYTVIGDTVNTASRIESLCKAVGKPLLLSGEVARQMGESDIELRSLGTRALRGRTREIELFTAEVDQPDPPEAQSLEESSSQLLPIGG